MENIYIASDHRGYALKNILISSQKLMHYNFVDLGSYDEKPVDYPDYASEIAKILKTNPYSRGILICNSGIGISIGANRFPHIRAALCYNTELAKVSREHNDANILVLGAKYISDSTAIECVQVFLNTNFLGARHQNRVAKLTTLGF